MDELKMGIMPKKLTKAASQNLKLLHANLASQLALHQHLKKVLLKEAELTAGCDILELELIQQRKAEISFKVAKVESARQKIVADLSAEFNLENQLLTLKQLAKLASKGESKNLLSLHAQLTVLIDEIKQLGKKTSLTAKARLISIQDTTDQINKWMAYHTFYSKKGGIKNTSQSRFLSRRI